jgi:benzodiazapine receptor
MAELTRGRSAAALVGFLVVTFAVSGVAGALTAPQIAQWYHGLRQPPLSPPDWVFAPVWTVLYALMAVAAWLAWKTRVSSCRSGGLRMWAVQLGINFLWSFVFFRMHAKGFAVLDLVILIVAIVFTMRPFFTIKPLAAWLLAPYLAWSCFALYLNVGIVVLNR